MSSGTAAAAPPGDVPPPGAQGGPSPPPAATAAAAPGDAAAAAAAVVSPVGAASPSPLKLLMATDRQARAMALAGLAAAEEENKPGVEGGVSSPTVGVAWEWRQMVGFFTELPLLWAALKAAMPAIGMRSRLNLCPPPPMSATEEQVPKQAPLTLTSRIALPDAMGAINHAAALSADDQPAVSVVLRVNGSVLPFVCPATVQPAGMVGSRSEGGMYQVGNRGSGWRRVSVSMPPAPEQSGQNMHGVIAFTLPP